MNKNLRKKFNGEAQKVKKQRQNSLFIETPWFARSEYDWKLSTIIVLKRNIK